MKVSWSGIARALLVSAAGAGLVFGATRATGAVTVAPAQAQHSSVAAATSPVRGSQLVCPGPELKGVPGLKDLAVPVRVTAAAAPVAALGGLRSASTAGALSLTGLPGGDLAPALTSRGKVGWAGVAKASAVLVSGTQSMAPGIAATQAWLVPSGDQRSLGSAPCQQAGAEFWILAGGGAPGRQERLVLTNPGGNPVSVDVTLHGGEGPVASSNGKGVVVPAHGRAAVLLDSISGDLGSPAVHVVAQGGLVSAVVNDLWLDGTRAAGSDDATPSAAPSRVQVVPAVPVEGKAVLRVAVPGSGEAVVQARVLTAQGPRALPSGAVVRVDGGSVADIDLSRLPAATVGIQVRADVPVVAAALTYRVKGSAPGDLAWSASTEGLAGVAGLPLDSPGAGSTPLSRNLWLTATGDSAAVQVVTVDARGAVRSQTAQVAPDTTSAVPVAGATSVWVRRLSGAGEVHAGVVSWVNDAQGTLFTSTPLRDSALRTTTPGLRPATP